MKRLFTALLALVLCLSIVGVAESKATIVTTTFPLYDIAKNVVGDMMNVVYNPNFFEEENKECDILYALSEEADPWTKELKDVKVIYALDGIELIEGENDIFTAPINVMVAAGNLAMKLGTDDPANMEAFQMNFVLYFTLINDVDTQFREIDFEGKTITCSDGSMAYFAKEYGVQIQDGEEACVLSTYNFPSEEDQLLSYAELMLKNLAALTGK